MVKMKLDSKIALLTEEIGSLKSQCSKYRRERETYKDMVDGLQKNRKASGTYVHVGKQRPITNKGF